MKADNTLKFKYAIEQVLCNISVDHTCLCGEPLRMYIRVRFEEEDHRDINLDDKYCIFKNLDNFDYDCPKCGITFCFMDGKLTVVDKHE